MVVTKRTAVFFGILVAVCGLSIAVVTVLKYAAAPATTSSITTTLPDATVSAIDPTPVAVQNAYADFVYPLGMRPTAQGDKTPPLLASYQYVYQGSGSWQLAISINRLAEPTLTDDSGYGLRKADPDRYQESTITIGSNTFVVMTDMQANGFNRVAFLLHGTLSADIAVYGNDPLGDDGLTAVFKQVLSSWHWH